MSTITTTTVEVLMVLFDVRCVKEYAESDSVDDAADIDDYDIKMTTTMVMTTTMTIRMRSIRSSYLGTA